MKNVGLLLDDQCKMMAAICNIPIVIIDGKTKIGQKCKGLELRWSDVVAMKLVAMICMGNEDVMRIMYRDFEGDNKDVAPLQKMQRK